MKRTTCRAWINQPSTLQALHRHHGKRVIIVEDLPSGGYHAHFADPDPEVSIFAPPFALSWGWKTNQPTSP